VTFDVNKASHSRILGSLQKFGAQELYSSPGISSCIFLNRFESSITENLRRGQYIPNGLIKRRLIHHPAPESEMVYEPTLKKN
jgi:hypothetical protein